jgi:hypothetical protein
LLIAQTLFVPCASFVSIAMKGDNPPQVQGTSVHSSSTPEEKIQDADVALAFIEQHGRIEYTPEQEKAVIRKIDWALMPLVR